MDISTPYPMLPAPVYQDYLWGGCRIPALYDRPVSMPVCAESWEISCRAEGMSIITNGPLSGRPLTDALQLHGDRILGSACTTAGFPLLIKLIDARQRLSLQVHPSDATAARFGGEAKTEMWYVLESTPDARVYAGLTDGCTEGAFRRALHGGAVGELLCETAVRPGDAIFIPGGRVHAIAEGCLLLEVQQSSNTTYRVYDWGRVDADGAPRELHLEQAIRVIDWNSDAPRPTRPTPLPAREGMQRSEILSCSHFDIQRWELTHTSDHTVDPASFEALFVETGCIKLAWKHGELTLPRGTSCLIPAAQQSYTLIPDGPASLIVTRLPA